jgi:hypothetical protein
MINANFSSRVIDLSRAIASSVLAMLLCLAAQGCAAGDHQAAYASPDDAARAFVTALRTNDKPSLKRVLGPEADDIIDSGDAVSDQSARQRFLSAYDEKNQLVRSDAGGMLLVVGANDWPLPIPIVLDSDTGKWSFDSEAGREEMLNRRIGRNELDVIQVCQAIVDAQEEYVQRDPDGDDVPEYARKFLSDPGTRDGLYWPTKEGEPLSPLGPLVAEAVDEGYGTASNPTGEPRPYHGYCYRMLTAQGPAADGGAIDYIVNGRMIGGFAVVAYPADYGNSGIMTFMVNHRGIVYQRDLGENTTKIARSMTTFDPSPEWKQVDSRTASLGSGDKVQGK